MSQHLAPIRIVLANHSQCFSVLHTDSIYSRTSLNNYERSYVHSLVILLGVTIEKYMVYIMRLCSIYIIICYSATRNPIISYFYASIIIDLRFEEKRKRE